MDSHLTSQSSTIFRSVHSLIYIFDAESPELLSSDTHYFLKCLAALRDQNSTPPLPSSQVPSTDSTAPGEPNDARGGPTVFVLLHKMDLVPAGQEVSKANEFKNDVTKRAAEAGWNGAPLQFFGTSIWNETLYKVRRPFPELGYRIDVSKSCRPGPSSLLISCHPSPPFAAISLNSSR